MRNMRSIGIDLEPWVKKGLLHFHAVSAFPNRDWKKHPAYHPGRSPENTKPEIVVVDALTDFVSLGAFNEVRQMILRVVIS